VPRVPLRMPGRSGPANGRGSTADENVPVPGPPPRRIGLLHEMSSPSSDWTARQPHARWVVRMKEAACINRCGQERLPQWGPG
jgi:hypothetical protein